VFDPTDTRTFASEREIRSRWFRIAIVAVVIYAILFLAALNAGLTARPPIITNTVPGVQATFIAPSTFQIVVRAALDALIKWPLVAGILFIGYILAWMASGQTAWLLRLVRSKFDR
jgi:hypothetical protein